MKQVFIYNKKDEAVIALWGNQEHTIDKKSFYPIEEGIATVWLKHHPELEIKEMSEVRVEVEEEKEPAKEKKVGRPAKEK